MLNRRSAHSPGSDLLDQIEQSMARQMVEAVHAARLCCDAVGTATLPCGFFF
jgi:hypothetical protein